MNEVSCGATKPAVEDWPRGALDRVASLEAEVVTLKRQLSYAKYPWWRKDKLGWPIELWGEENGNRHRFRNGLRIICQNIRKITG